MEKLNGKVRACFRSPWVKGDGLHSLAGKGCHVFHRIQVTLKKFWVLVIKAMPETVFRPVASSPNLQIRKCVTFAKISRLSGQLTDATKAVALSHGTPPILNHHSGWNDML